MRFSRELKRAPLGTEVISPDRRRFERRVWWGVAVAMTMLSVVVGFLAWSRFTAEPLASNEDVPSSLSEVVQSTSTTELVTPVSPCLEAVRSAVPQASESPDLEALLWSLDACVTLDDWDRALAEISPTVAEEPVSAVFYCQSEPELQPALLCLEAIRKGLVEPLPMGDVAVQGEVDTRKDAMTAGRVLGSAPGNRIDISWFNVDEDGQMLEGISFTYRISGPLPAPITGLADTGFSGPIRIPGWSPGMTIRVAMISTEDPSLTSSFPYTYVEESWTPGSPPPTQVVQ